MGLESEIQKNPNPIPDSGVKKALDPQHCLSQSL
jgi:hypothetical protein